MKNTITPFLWFKDSAEQAAAFYQSIFNTSVTTEKHPEAMATEFEIGGQRFIVLNGNPGFDFNESISFVINCTTQEQVDYYWDRLREGGKEQRCGWLKDKYGVSWQVVPEILPKYLQASDRKKANNVLQAMLRMIKINIAELESAYHS